MAIPINLDELERIVEALKVVLSARGIFRSPQGKEPDEHTPKHEEALEPISILIADRHRILRQGLRMLLETEPGFRVVGETGDGETTIRLVRELKPAIPLLGLPMPRMGLEALAKLPMSVRTIVLAAAVETPWIVRVRQFGERAVVLKSSPCNVLFECIRHVMARR
jgi:DNA-binding NarL/FixJ family response regulator